MTVHVDPTTGSGDPVSNPSNRARGPVGGGDARNSSMDVRCYSCNTPLGQLEAAVEEHVAAGRAWPEICRHLGVETLCCMKHLQTQATAGQPVGRTEWSASPAHAP